jgi:hypothetical protein
LRRTVSSIVFSDSVGSTISLWRKLRDQGEATLLAGSVNGTSSFLFT